MQKKKKKEREPQRSNKQFSFFWGGGGSHSVCNSVCDKTMFFLQPRHNLIPYKRTLTDINNNSP